MAETTTRTRPRGDTPDNPAQLSKGTWKDTLKRTIREFKEDDLTLLAAALTYYGVLAIFPALLVLVSILGLLGASTTQPLIDNLASLAPGAARDIVTNAIQNLQRASGAAGLAFIFGILAALWSASGYVGGFIKASNIIYEVEEGRPFWQLRPLQIAVTVVLVLVAAAISVSIVVTGPLAQKVGDVIGLGSTAVTVWNIAKWPVIALLVSQVIAFLYWVAPNVRQPGYKWMSPGGILAVVVWVIATAIFAFYVSHFGSYNKTYGSLAAVIIFLVWLWISNIAILLGAEFDAEMQRSRAIQPGHPSDEEPYVELRDTRKIDKARDQGLG